MNPWQPDDFSGRPGRAAAPSAEELRLIEGLRRKEESAFVALVERHQSMLKRVARLYVPSEAVAEEVVQETWLAVLEGIDRFEGRSSLQTWMFRILANRARTRGEREGRTVTFSALAAQEATGNEPAVAPERFRGASDQYPGHWTVPLPRWGENPEQWVTSNETLAYLKRALETLPEAQRTVVMLRDLQEWTAEEVCGTLGLTEANQRVLLHRGRSTLRHALEQHFESRVG